MALFDEIKKFKDKYLSGANAEEENDERKVADKRYCEAIADDKWFDYLDKFRLDKDDLETFKHVQNFYYDYDYEGTIRLIDEVFARLGESDLGKVLLPYYADANLKEAEFKTHKRKACADIAISFYMQVLSIMPDNKLAKLNISNAFLLTEQLLVARNWLLPLIKTNMEERAKNLYRDNVDRMRTVKFMDVPFTDRKKVLLVNDEDILAAFYNKPIPGFNYCFTIFDKPQDVKFFPEMSGAFVAHPKQTDHYIDMKRYEITVLEKKMEDMKLFFQSAGASYYKISCRQKENYDILVNLGFRIGSNSTFNPDAENSTLKPKDFEEVCYFEERLSPKTLPSLNPNLVWMEEWQPLWNEREKGQLSLRYTLKLNDSEKLMPKEREDIKAYFESKEQKVNGDILYYYFSDSDCTTNMELDVVAYFKPLSEFVDASISLTEKEYKAAVADCLKDDGMISEKERLFLEIRRKSLNISEDRAKEIEDICLQALFTPNEREYMRLYKGMLELGIDEKARALLNKCVSDFGISESRRQFIERLVR